MTSLAVAQQEIVSDYQHREKVVNEEFKIWKKTVPLLYDTIKTAALDAPLLTLAWLPEYSYLDNKNTVSVRVLLGTSVGNNDAAESLILASLTLPSTLAPDFSTVLPNATSLPVPLLNVDSAVDFKVVKSWKHPGGDVSKVQVSPNLEKVATCGLDGVVYVYDLKDLAAPVVEFKYHKQAVSALEWVDNERFFSGSNDTQIALWEILKPSTPIQVFKSHSAAINDISYNQHGNGVFVSVADDHTIQVHDIKARNTLLEALEVSVVVQIDTEDIINAVAFHPEIATLFLVGGDDNTVSLYDLRNPQKPIRKFFGHNDTVVGLQWDPLADPRSFLSWGLDRRVLLWDISALDEEFTYPTAEEPTNSRRKPVRTADPCLKFIHGGHTRLVNGAAFHPTLRGIVASGGSDNLLEVWKVKSAIEEEEEEDEEEEDEEKDTDMKE